jgi:hypothetical protein
MYKALGSQSFFRTRTVFARHTNRRTDRWSSTYFTVEIVQDDHSNVAKN